MAKKAFNTTDEAVNLYDEIYCSKVDAQDKITRTEPPLLLSDFVEDFNTPLQQTNVNLDEALEDKIFDPLEDDLEEDQERPRLQNVQQSMQAAKATGKLLATMTDSLVPSILCAVAKSDNVQNYKASDVERQELETAFTNYSRLKGGDIPSGMALVIAIACIYGAKVPIAISNGKRVKSQNNSEA